MGPLLPLPTRPYLLLTLFLGVLVPLRDFSKEDIDALLLLRDEHWVGMLHAKTTL